jgi:hypothetical protein
MQLACKQEKQKQLFDVVLVEHIEYMKARMRCEATAKNLISDANEIKNE